MAKKLSFSIQLENSGKLAKELANVELGLVDIGKVLKQAKKDIDVFNNGTKEQREELAKQGKTVESVTKTYSTYRAEQISLQTEAKRLRLDLRQQAQDFDLLKRNVPTDSLLALRRRYTQLTKEIAGLSEEARELPKNLNKIDEAAQVKKRIDEMGESVGDFRSQVGSYRKAIEDMLGGGVEGIFSSFIDLIGGGGGGINPWLLGLTAIGGTLVAIGGYVNQVTLEFAKLNDEVFRLTGETGESLAEITTRVQGISQTFGKDFTEVLVSVNALTKNVTGDFSKSLDLVTDGFILGADATQQYLDNLEEYSTQAEAAGLSGEQLNAILIKSAQEGIYSDKGIDTVKEFGLRIREQTNTTKIALEQAFGKKFTKELFDNINDGSEDTVGALAKVAGKLRDTALTAKQEGQVLADVFAGPGEDAGLRFIKTLADIEEGYENIAIASTAYQRLQEETLRVNTELAVEQQKLSATLAGTGISFENLKTQGKSLGTSLINDVASSFQVINDIYNEKGFFAALTTSGGSDEFTKRLEENAKKNLEALVEVQEGEKEAAEEREQNAIKGKLGLQDLSAEQARLKNEVDLARASGKDYTVVLEKYNEVTKQVSLATGIFNKNVSSTKSNFQALAADGSIKQLQKEVSDLQKSINSASPEEALKLIEKLNSAELDLSKAKKELDDFKKEVREANIEALPIEDQVKILAEGIEKEKQLRIASANARILDEEDLANRIKEINIQTDIEILNNSLKSYEKGEADYLKTINKISAKKAELDQFSLEVDLKKSETNINELVLLTENYLNNTVEDQGELNTRINATRLSGEIAFINEQLKLAKLSGEERLKLEAQLIQSEQALKIEQAKLTVGFDTTNTDIDNQQLVAPEFNPENIEASLEAIRSFEEQRAQLEAEKALARLENEKALLIELGESTLEIEAQISEAQLSADELKNAELIKNHKDRLKQQEIAQRESDKIMIDLIGGTADLIGGLFDGTIESGEDAAQAIVGLMLETLEAIVLAQVAAATAQSLAQPDSVATFGATGIARAAILTALIKAGFSVAKSAIGSIIAEDGAYLNDGGYMRGPSHANGGIGFRIAGSPVRHEMQGGESVIKREATSKWLGLLSAINEDGGGKSFSSDSGKWKSVLQGMQGMSFADGGLIGSGSQANFPNIAQPTLIVTETRINPKDFEGIIEEVVAAQTANLVPVIEQISGNVIIGLQQKERLSERTRSAEDGNTV